MEERIYTPQEVADILKIKKTTVYEMIKKGTLEATKMGKQFRIADSSVQKVLHGTQNTVQTLSTAFVPDSSKAPSFPNRQSEAVNGLIVCGQDLLLDILCQQANDVLGENRFLRSYQGSYNALQALYKEEVHVATAHLWDWQTDEYNMAYIPHLLPGEQVCVYHVCNRPVYIYVAKGNPKKITSFEDFCRKDVTIVNRERGSGIRVLLDSLLAKNEIEPTTINGYSHVVNSHLAAAGVIATKGADCALGNAGGAAQYPNVEKVLFKQESYDLIFRKSLEDSTEIQTLLQILRSTPFQQMIAGMGEYDVSQMGIEILISKKK